MKNRKTLEKLILGGLLLLTTGSLFAQTQKVHTLQAKNSSGTTTMNSDALIQMDSDNKGLLLPRIALTGANKVAPLTAHTAGMVVYNTATVVASGTGATAIEAVTPGYYYNNGTKWVKIANTDIADITNDAWKNNIATNAVELETKADGTARTTGTEVVITDTGNVGIGVSASGTTDGRLTVKGRAVLLKSDESPNYSEVLALQRFSPTTSTEAPYLSFYHQKYGESTVRKMGFIRTGFVNSSSDHSVLEIQSIYGHLINQPYNENNDNGYIALNRYGGRVRIGGGFGLTSLPSEKLEVVGNGKFTGTVSTTGVLTTSDKRFKQGIKPVTSAMQTVNKLQPVSYTWSALGKKNGGDNKKHIGFIAQEVEKILPNLVNTDAKGYKSVNYIEVVPVLTKALQEQQKAIEKQQKEIDQLKAMVKKLLK